VSAARKDKLRVVQTEEWERKLIVDEHGRPKNLLANVYAILAGSPEWAGVLALNEARGEIEMVNPAPHVDHEGPWTLRTWTDQDDTLAAIWIQRRYRIGVKPDVVATAVGAIASQRRYNPLTREIAALTWDGVARLDTWLTRYCCAEDTPYTRAVGACWLRGAMGRAFAPGVKFDTALILEGEQGAGKSTVFAILGGAYFSDELGDLKDKDTKLSIGRSWIIEIAELSTLNRHEVEQVKQFLSKTTDNYRPVWGRRPIDVPRRCVFGGSTNRSDYLRDETGARRFWPVKCPAEIDLEGLRRDRDQLLAEALDGWKRLGKAGIELPRELRAAQREETEQRRQVDAWEDPVRAYLTNKTSASVGDVLEDALDLKKDRWGRSEQMRLASVMVALGWTRKRIRFGTELVWRYVPPPPDPPQPPPVPDGGQAVPNGSGTTAQPKEAGVPNVPNLPTSGGGAGSCENPKPEEAIEVRNVRNVRNNREIEGSSAFPTSFPTPSPVGNSAAAWDARYQEHLARAPGAIGAALAATTAELGPRPEDVPDV